MRRFAHWAFIILSETSSPPRKALDKTHSWWRHPKIYFNESWLIYHATLWHFWRSFRYNSSRHYFHKKSDDRYFGYRYFEWVLTLVNGSFFSFVMNICQKKYLFMEKNTPFNRSPQIFGTIPGSNTRPSFVICCLLLTKYFFNVLFSDFLS